MGFEKKTIDNHADILKTHFAGRGWFIPKDTHHEVGMTLRGLIGALRCVALHGLPGCTILHDKEVYPPRWIIIEGTAPEEIQRELKLNAPKEPDWSFLTKPWPLLLDLMEEQV